VRNRIEVSVFQVPVPIGAWREVLHPSAGRQQRSVGLRMSAATAAILLNVGVLAMLRLDVDPAGAVPTRRAGSLENGALVQTLLIEPPRLGVRVGDVAQAPNPVQGPRRLSPLAPHKLEGSAMAVGDAAWSRGALATAISLLPPEFERTRLRAVYRERLEARLAHLAETTESSQIESSGGCIVRVRQGESGEVVDVAVIRCAHSTKVRAELAAAIRRASPLPPPPRADVFEAELVINIGERVDVVL
jgi:hypothetical protein